MNFQLIISDAFNFFRSHLVQIATLCVPWLLIIAVVQNLIVDNIDPSQGISALFILAWAFKLLIYPIYTAALILLMAKRAQRQLPGNSELLSSAIKIWQPFFMVYVMRVGLSALGAMFLVVPGIYIAVRLSFAEFYMTLETIKPVEAIQKSFDATKPYFFHILLLMGVFITPLWMLDLILANLLRGKEAVLILNILIATAMAFLMLFLDVIMFRVYMSVTQKNTDL